MNEPLYGLRPAHLGLVDITPKEMLFWLYCPIKLPHGDMVLPPNLEQFRPLLLRVWDDVPAQKWRERYVYLTAKTLWVSPENPGNRPGWHSDGFMTSDLNYIWSDTNGTLFWVPDEPTTFVQDHEKSLVEMHDAAECGPVATYPDRHLLRLDQSVIHRVADVTKAGMRSFVKVSISEHEYRLAGNSINHALPTSWEYADRKAERNTPETATLTRKEHPNAER